VARDSQTDTSHESCITQLIRGVTERCVTRDSSLCCESILGKARAWPTSLKTSAIGLPQNYALAKNTAAMCFDMADQIDPLDAVSSRGSRIPSAPRDSSALMRNRRVDASLPWPADQVRYGERRAPTPHRSNIPFVFFRTEFFDQDAQFLRRVGAQA
jgi:hypothetical protein